VEYIINAFLITSGIIIALAIVPMMITLPGYIIRTTKRYAKAAKVAQADINRVKAFNELNKLVIASQAEAKSRAQSRINSDPDVAQAGAVLSKHPWSHRQSKTSKTARCAALKDLRALIPNNADRKIVIECSKAQ
jgi:hypothetical protein